MRITAILVVHLLLLTLSAMSAEAAECLPNFVVIFCDDLGWGDLGCSDCMAT